MNYNLKKHITPYGYQVEGVNYSLNHDYCIIGDEMGLGKTLQGIMLDQHLRFDGPIKTLIVCPAFLRETWKQEYRELSNSEETIAILSTTKQVQESKFKEDIILISYHALQHAAYLFEVADLIIFDEIHYLKSLDAKRTIAAHKFIWDFKPPRVLGLSGTPITKGVDDWFSLIGLMGYNPKETSGVKVQGNIWEFREKFMTLSPKYLRMGIKKYEGLRNVPELKKLLKGKYIRRLAKDHLELPPAIDKEIIASYKSDPKLEAEWEAFLTNKGKDVTAKRESALAKVKFTIDYCKGLLKEGELPLVVFSDHVEPAQLLAKGLKFPLITGAVPMAKRKIILEQFKAGEVDGIVITIGAGKEGLTLTKSWNCVFNDLCWLSTTLAQARKRIDRISQTRKPIFHNIVGSKQDSYLIKRLIEQSKIIGEAT